MDLNKDNAKKCLRCKLMDLSSAEYCDCGYKFTNEVMDKHKAYIFDKERRRKGIKMIIGGVGSFVLGIILTAISIHISEKSNHKYYYLFSALIFGGAIAIYRGALLVIGERK